MFLQTYGDDPPDEYLPFQLDGVVSPGERGPSVVPLWEQILDWTLPWAIGLFLVVAVCRCLFSFGDWLVFELGDWIRRRRH